MRILFLSGWFPYPPDNGSKLRIYHLLAGLAAQHEVMLLSFGDAVETPPPPELAKLCTIRQVVPWQPFRPTSWRARRGFLSLTPRSVIDTYSATMAHAIARAVAEQSFDLVIASQLAMAGYVRHFAAIPALFEEVELGLMIERYQQARSPSGRLRERLAWLKHRHYVSQVLRQFQACTVVSAREGQLVRTVIPAYKAIEIIPNCVNLADYEAIQATPQPNSLIFTGSFRYFANYEAMQWFLQAVFPLVQAQCPDTWLTITGDPANQPLPPASHVRITGVVPDVRPLIAGAWCSIVPMHSGGGTRLKILEAMALGTPVIATTKGIEGIAAQDGVHLLVADTPQAFADAILRLFAQPELRHQLAKQGYQLVRTSYNWATTLPHFLQLIERVVKAPTNMLSSDARS